MVNVILGICILVLAAYIFATKNTKFVRDDNYNVAYMTVLDNEDQTLVELTHECTNCQCHVNYYDKYCSVCGCYLEGLLEDKE